MRRVSDLAVTPPATGRVLGDRYRLTTRLAVGGMGEVWVAIDEILGRRVAVKILRDEFLESPLFLARFRSEAKHTAALAHSGVAHIFDYGEDHIGGRCTAYLVMELVGGPPLSDLLAARGPLPIATTIEWLAQAAEALGAAHRIGLVHRDVKPGNLLVVGNTIKITDFGIARTMSSAPVTDAGQVVGTARYMSPEQATGAEATPASDVYSLAIVGYEMLTGRPPFTEGNALAVANAHLRKQPPPLPQHIPPALRELLATALSKDPKRRPGDADAFARALRSLQAPAAATLSPLLDETVAATALPVRRVRSNIDTAAFAALPPPTRLLDHDRTAVAPPSPRVNAIIADRRSTRRSWRAVIVATIGCVAAALVLLAGTHRTPNTPKDLVPADSGALQAVAGTTPDTAPQPTPQTTPVSAPVVVQVTPSTSPATTTTIAVATTTRPAPTAAPPPSTRSKAKGGPGKGKGR